MKLVTMLACALAIAWSQGHAQPFGARQDLFVRYKADVSLAERKSIEAALGVAGTSAVPSVEAQLLRLKPTIDPIAAIEKARADPRFELVDVGVADYRKPLVPLVQSVPLDAATQAAVERFMASPRNAGAQLFRLRSSDLVERMFDRGFGTKDALPKPKSLVLDLPGDESAVLVQRPGPEVGAENSTSWVGEVFPRTQVGDQAAGYAQFTYRDGKLLGSVTMGSKVYRVAPVADGVHAVSPVQADGLPPEHPPGSAPAVGPLPPAGAAPPPPSSHKDAAPQKVSVVIGLTQAASDRNPDLALLEAHLVNQFNEASRNSQVEVRLVSLGIRSFAFSEQHISADLQELRAGSSLAALRAWRKTAGANIAILITTSDDACGEAAAIQAEAHTAYAVVSEGCAIDNFSFTHELGHIFGARHDVDADPVDHPYPWGHGFASKTWRTLMAYPSACGSSSCPRVLYWSSPDVKLSGLRMGTPQRHHNARVLRQTASTIMQLKSPVAEPD